MMRKLCKITVNDQTFFANRGDILLDAALLNGVDLPHDCRSGICGACRVRLMEGRVFRHQDDDHGDLIHACQARVISNLQIATEETPETLSISARVAKLTRLSPDIVEVRLKLSKSLRFLPGQYCKVQFRGFPARSFSPTFPIEGAPDRRVLHFHIRIVADGRVSSALGHQIKVGHSVRVTGPFGAAFLRTDHHGGMVLVSSGTGFAPLWSIAVAAILERPQRELIFIVGARSLQSLYMLGALCRLARFPNVTIVPVVSEAQSFSEAIRVGRPSDHTPNLSPDDVVYTAGAPALTAHVAEIAEACGAKCYTDPFVAEGTHGERPNPVFRMAAWLGGELRGSHAGQGQPS
jgi:NAD(P)H-flavin reductase/ferredoxin